LAARLNSFSAKGMTRGLEVTAENFLERGARAVSQQSIYVGRIEARTGLSSIAQLKHLDANFKGTRL